MTTIVVSFGNYGLRDAHRAGITSPSPATSQRIRTLVTSATLHRCSPLKSAVSIFCHFSAVCLETLQCLAKSLVLMPEKIIATRSRFPNMRQFSHSCLSFAFEICSAILSAFVFFAS